MADSIWKMEEGKRRRRMRGVRGNEVLVECELLKHRHAVVCGLFDNVKTGLGYQTYEIGTNHMTDHHSNIEVQIISTPEGKYQQAIIACCLLLHILAQLLLRTYLEPNYHGWD